MTRAKDVHISWWCFFYVAAAVAARVHVMIVSVFGSVSVSVCVCFGTLLGKGNGKFMQIMFPNTDKTGILPVLPAGGLKTLQCTRLGCDRDMFVLHVVLLIVCPLCSGSYLPYTNISCCYGLSFFWQGHINRFYRQSISISSSFVLPSGLKYRFGVLCALRARRA